MTWHLLPHEKNRRPAKRVLFRDQWLTAEEIAARIGMSANAVRNRIAKGHPLDATHVRLGPEPRSYEFRGEQLTVKAIALVLGITESNVYKRVIGGRVLDGDELKQPRQPQEGTTFLSFNGITDTISGWAGRTGLPIATLWQRYHYRGWTVEAALTTPPGNSSPRIALKRRNQRILHQMIEAFRRDLATIAEHAQTEHQPNQTGGYQPTSHGDLLTGVGSIARDLQLIARSQP